MTSYRFYKTVATALQIYFRFLTGPRPTFRESKAISVPNFDQISQSVAEILLLAVSENKWPPY